MFCGVRLSRTSPDECRQKMQHNDFLRISFCPIHGVGVPIRGVGFR